LASLIEPGSQQYCPKNTFEQRLITAAASQPGLVEVFNQIFVQVWTNDIELDLLLVSQEHPSGMLITLYLDCRDKGPRCT